MQLILLSGGSGKRLWPLSNSSRSKQFLRLLTSPDGSPESMIQRVVRQLHDAGMDKNLTIATSASQRDAIIAQLGRDVRIVTEPERRDTFPAIALATEYLGRELGVGDDEVVVVMPCDPYTESGYFDAVIEMCRAVGNDMADLMLMGVRPTGPSTKYGYLVPSTDNPNLLESFTEKPDAVHAERLLASGAVWNGGVFAFRLGFIRRITRRYLTAATFDDFRKRYAELPRISFDYEVAERTSSIGVIYYSGLWEDLGTWDMLSVEMEGSTVGRAVQKDSSGTTVINELNIPVLCHSTRNLIVAASPDGILVADKDSTDRIKDAVGEVETRPMFEERRWGVYKVIDTEKFSDGYSILTKQLTLNPGCSISYQKHTHRDEVWTFVDGQGEIVINGERSQVGRGDTVTIPQGCLHALRAVTPLTFIEVQRGTELIEEDIERFDYEW